jgi:hypothetical protein
VSTRRTLLGVIAEKDGMICLQTSDNVWFPLNGNSGVAADFRESFNAPQPNGKRRFEQWKTFPNMCAPRASE